jgi:hypothetical protein
VVLGYIVVDLFPGDVDSSDHPSVREFRKILDKTVMPYECSLTHFVIDHGVVIFRFDNNEKILEILEDLKKVTGVKATAYGGDDIGIEKIKQLLKKPK